MGEKLKQVLFNPENTFISVAKVIAVFCALAYWIWYVAKLDSRIQNLEQRMPTETTISDAINLAFQNQVPKMILQFDERYERLPK